LNERQRLFAAEYVVDLNATAAAIRAGYSPKGARQHGHKLLTNADIQKVIQELNRERIQRVCADGDRVLHEYARVAFSDVRALLDAEGDIMPAGEWSDDAAGAVSSYRTKTTNRGEDVIETTKEIRLWNKPQALRALAENLQVFAPERREETITVVIGGAD
jgi:phage terminase small subunit